MAPRQPTFLCHHCLSLASCHHGCCQGIVRWQNGWPKNCSIQPNQWQGTWWTRSIIYHEFSSIIRRLHYPWTNHLIVSGRHIKAGIFRLFITSEVDPLWKQSCLWYCISLFLFVYHFTLCSHIEFGSEVTASTLCQLWPLPDLWIFLDDHWHKLIFDQDSDWESITVAFSLSLCWAWIVFQQTESSEQTDRKRATLRAAQHWSFGSL